MKQEIKKLTEINGEKVSTYKKNIDRINQLTTELETNRECYEKSASEIQSLKDQISSLQLLQQTFREQNEMLSEDFLSKEDRLHNKIYTLSTHLKFTQTDLSTLRTQHFKTTHLLSMSHEDLLSHQSVISTLRHQITTLTS